MPRPPTSAALRRKILTDLRAINQTMRYIVGEWDGPWGDLPSQDLPENNPRALDDVINDLARVRRILDAIQTLAADRIRELRDAKDGA